MGGWKLVRDCAVTLVAAAPPDARLGAGLEELAAAFTGRGGLNAGPLRWAGLVVLAGGMSGRIELLALRAMLESWQLILDKDDRSQTRPRPTK